VLVIYCSTNTLRSFFNLLLLVLENWCRRNTQRLLVTVGGPVRHGPGQCGGVKVVLGVGSPGMLCWSS
jgi:hypothetical protein